MKITELELIKRELKPKIWINANKMVKCLIDSGADTPVWCRGSKLLVETFEGVEKTDLKFIIGGFGNGRSIADVYRIPKFVIGVDGIIFLNFLVAVHDRKDMNIDMVLPYTLFLESNIEFINLGETPRMIIKTNRSEFGMFYRRISLNKGKIDLLKQELGLTDKDLQKYNIMSSSIILSQDETEK